ncbi:hypothetical protein DUNSADRAFT_7579, partial [Dunaliella salina]
MLEIGVPSPYVLENVVIELAGMLASAGRACQLLLLPSFHAWKQCYSSSSSSSSSGRPAESTLNKKSDHHISSTQLPSPAGFPRTIPSQHSFSSRTSSWQAPFSLASHVRFQSVVPQAFGMDDNNIGELHSQQSGRAPGKGGSRGGGRTGQGGQGGFPDGGKSWDERVPSLEACIQNAANATHLPPNSMVFCMYNLAKRIGMDTKRGVQYSSRERADVADAAMNLIKHFLGSTSSYGAPISTSHPPVLQLDSKHLGVLAWSLSVMVRFDESLGAGARQLCCALAERAAQPGVIRANAREACRSWAGVLYGLAKAGVKCHDDARVEQLFLFCMEQELPGLLGEGQVCQPQSTSTIAMACVDAGYEGSMEPFISAIAKRVG